MIYTIRGILTEADVTGSFIVIECGGVGYRLTVTANTLTSLPAPAFTPSGDTAEGAQVKVYTYMAVKEDAVELFGFASKEELEAFKLLISVSGVGPKAATSILSLLTPKKLAFAIASDDTKTISRAPGVGAKTAARVVLELKEKMAKAFPLGGAEEAPSPKKEKAAADFFFTGCVLED